MLILVATFALTAAATYLGVERSHRRFWTRYEKREVQGDGVVTPFRRDASRRTYVAPVPGSRAPLRVRAVAQWSIVLGQMAVPGGLLGLFGLLAYGMGVVGLPGTILACLIWREGIRLLQADERVVRSAEKTADFACILNVCVVAAAYLLLLFGVVELAVVMFVYAAISLAHAHMLRIAADDLRAFLERRAEATAWKPAVRAVPSAA